MRNRLTSFMAGRYGVDELSICMIALSFVLWFVNIFLRDMIIIDIVSYIIIIMYFARVFSKNTYKRSRENAIFLKYFNPILSLVRKWAKIVKEARRYKHFKCKSCGQVLRIPRGKGNVSITCPKCRSNFLGRT